MVLVGDGTITLQGAASLDTLNVTGTPAFPIATDELVTVFGGRNEESLNVTLDGDDNEDIDLSEEDYQVAVVDADATGIKNISLGGGDLVIVEESNALVSIEASEGLDTIVSRGTSVSVNLRGGATKIYPLGGKMTLEGYAASTGAGFGTGYEDVMAALDSGNIDFNRGRLSIGSGRHASISATRITKSSTSTTRRTTFIKSASRRITLPSTLAKTSTI